MPQPRSKYPLRVRHAGTDPVHAAKKRGARGHDTPCWLWLNPADPHIWCDDDAEITCTKCIERLAPPPLTYAVPGTVGPLQQRLAEVIENEVPTSYSALAGRRITETVETWRQDVERRIRPVVDEVLVGVIPGPARSIVVDILIERVLRSMDVGDGFPGEGVEE